MEPHTVRPAEHDTAHRPAAQTCPLGQAIPHAPQWRRSLLRSWQAPEQLVKPVAQVTEHAPREHT